MVQRKPHDIEEIEKWSPYDSMSLTCLHLNMPDGAQLKITIYSHSIYTARVQSDPQMQINSFTLNLGPYSLMGTQHCSKNLSKTT